MRYRGGGVGHKYMRLIEEWLYETGWGHEIPDIDVSEPHIVVEGEDQLQQEPIPAGEVSDSGTGSDSDDLLELDGGDDDDDDEEEEEEEEKMEGEGDSDEEEEEETIEGEFGYSNF